MDREVRAEVEYIEGKIKKFGLCLYLQPEPELQAAVLEALKPNYDVESLGHGVFKIRRNNHD